MIQTHPVIAVCGPPGSGKSTFAKALAKALQAPVVDMDHYQTFTDNKIEDVLASLSATDSTDDFYACFEVPQLDTDLQALANGKAIVLPNSEQVSLAQASEAIVFETHFGRAHPQTGPFIDYLIWLDCPLDIAIARKLTSFLDDFLTDNQPQNRHEQMSWLNNYLQQYQDGVRRTLDIQARTIPDKADLRLNGDTDVATMVQQALSALQQWRAEQRANLTPQDIATGSHSAYDYLRVESFCQDFVQLQLLHSGFSTGLFSALERHSCDKRQLLQQCDTDQQGLNFLLDSLIHHGIVEIQSQGSNAHNDSGADSLYQFTSDFHLAYQYQDLLKAKIEFSNFLAPDLLLHMDSFLRDEQQFMSESRLFELFDYHRALELSDENYRFTKRWMDLTTALTRYEAGVCIAEHDFNGYQQIMDIGGNSGEFVRQICATQPHIHATVVDLPVVCEVGRDHLKPTAQAGSVEFYPANALVDALPGHQCAITFKSILHDWPMDACERFIGQASKALRKGGELIIFERSQLDLQRHPMTYGTLSTAMFYRSYRRSQDYLPLLKAAGLVIIEAKQLTLETDFHLICARKV